MLLQPAIGSTDMSRSSSGRAHTPRDPIALVTADHRAAAAGSGGVASRVGASARPVGSSLSSGAVCGIRAVRAACIHEPDNGPRIRLVDAAEAPAWQRAAGKKANIWFLVRADVASLPFTGTL